MPTTIDLGVVSIISKGIHDPFLTYERLNEVRDSSGNWYQALKNVPTGINLNNEVFWILVRDNSVNGADISVRVVNPPTLTAAVDTTVNSTYSVVDGYTGLQTASNWYVYEADGVTLNHTSLNDTVNLTSYTLVGLSPSTNYIVKKENISGNFKSEMSNGVTILTPNNSINTPTDITVEGSPTSVPDLATVTLNSLPTTVNSTIDTVEFRVIKTSDGTEIGTTQSTTTLTLPITFTAPTLEVSTEYRFEIRCRDTVNIVDSVWGSVVATTLNNFGLTFDIFGDGSRVHLYEFDGNSLDTGAIANGTDTDVSYPLGKIDQCLNFNSQNSKIELGFPVLLYADDWSVSFWSKWDGTGQNSHYAPLHLGDLAVEWTSSGQHFATLNGSATGKERIYQDFSELHDDTWHFVTVTWNATSKALTLYIDGIDTQSSHTSGGGFVRSATTIAGYNTSTTTASATGFLDSLSIFNRELTATEVVTLAQEGIIS